MFQEKRICISVYAHPHNGCLQTSFYDNSTSMIVYILLVLEVLLPFKKRPESTGMVARNLVAGALGIRTNVSKEQRQKEKEILKEARGE